VTPNFAISNLENLPWLPERLIPASCHAPSPQAACTTRMQKSGCGGGFVGDPQAQVFDVVDRFVERLRSLRR
jgi:hypothetical protein